MRKHFDETSLKELARSIKLEGLIQPITVRPIGQAYELIAGERRLKAAQILGWETIDARVLNLSDEDAAIKGLIENLQRQDLSPVEEARGYKQLIDPPYKMTQEAVGQRVGKSQTAIARSLALLELPEDIQELMPRGIISEAHTRHLRKISDRTRQIDIARQADREGWTVKETERQVQDVLKSTGEPIHRRQSKRQESNGGAKGPLEADPLAETWVKLVHTPQVGTPGTWDVRYKGSGQWLFQVWAASDDPKSSLGDFFVRLGTTLGSRLVPKQALPTFKNVSDGDSLTEAN